MFGARLIQIQQSKNDNQAFPLKYLRNFRKQLIIVTNINLSIKKNKINFHFKQGLFQSKY